MWLWVRIRVRVRVNVSFKGRLEFWDDAVMDFVIARFFFNR